MKTLEERLNHYETEIEIFDKDTIEDEIDLFYIQRLILEENKNRMNDSLFYQLYSLDMKAIDLYNNVKNNKTIAVDYLGKIVNEFAMKNVSEYEKKHKKTA